MKDTAREIMMETMNYCNICKHSKRVGCGCGMVKNTVNNNSIALRLLF